MQRRRLIEYVATYRPSSAFFQSTGNGDGPTLLDAVKMPGELWHRQPATDHRGCELPEASSFVFPFYARLHTTAPEAYFHSFVLTTSSGDRLYGYCFTRYAPLPADRLAVVKLQVAFKMGVGEGSPAVMPLHFFEPWAVVLFSFHPFHNSFARLLLDYGGRRTPELVFKGATGCVVDGIAWHCFLTCSYAPTRPYHVDHLAPLAFGSSRQLK